MASLNRVCTEDLTFTPQGALNPRTGETSPGAPATVKGRFTRMQSLMKNSTGEQTQSDAVAIVKVQNSLLAPPKIGDTCEGKKVEAVEDIKDRTRLLGYRLKF